MHIITPNRHITAIQIILTTFQKETVTFAGSKFFNTPAKINRVKCLNLISRRNYNVCNDLNTHYVHGLLQQIS